MGSIQRDLAAKTCKIAVSVATGNAAAFVPSQLQLLTVLLKPESSFFTQSATLCVMNPLKPKFDRRS